MTNKSAKYIDRTLARAGRNVTVADLMRAAAHDGRHVTATRWARALRAVRS